MRFRLALLTLLLATPLAAQSPVITNDSVVRTGTLPNGLRYWIRSNEIPAKRLDLRLVVRAGSILEDDDQRGLAHFVEHMAFNGTTRFHRNELVQYLESIGVRFGADLNASTGFDETTYYLPVPTDKPGVVERAFDILQDWAHGVQFDSTDVANERGVVLGEWRSGLGAGSRVRDREFPVLFQGSRYAIRLPIGDTAVIAHVQVAPLKRFYHDWYRPDLMAVIAVGDYPIDELESLIRSRFGDLTAPATTRPRTETVVPEVAGARVTVTTDPELSTESVQLLVRRPATHYRTEDDERRALVTALLSTIGNQRLGDIQRRPDAPFVSAFFGQSELVRNVEVFALVVNAKEGRTADAFEATLTEQHRLGVHGVLPAELERAKASLLRSREQSAAEQDKAFSSTHVDRYVDAFLTGDATPSARTRLALATRLLPTIMLAEVNAAARDAALGTDRFIAVRAPDKEGQVLPDRSALLAVMARVDTLTVSPWTETTVDGPLVAAPPTPGRVTSTRSHPDLGIIEWRLSNNVRVLVKPTEFRADQILVAGTAPGGASLVPDADVTAAAFATAIARESGYGSFDASALRRRLAGSIATVSLQLDDLTQGFTGSTAPKDLGTFFELMWLAATAQRYDSSAVTAFFNRVRPQLANRDRIPFAAFSDTITLTLSGNHPRAQPLDLARFNAVDPLRAYAILQDRFRDYGNFTFVIVGNVDTLTLRPLVERWLGALPTTGRKETWRDVAPPFLRAPVTKVVHRGKEPVAVQIALFGGPTPDASDATEAAAAAAGSILETRLLETLREAMGATYSVNVSAGVHAQPRKARIGSINFTSDPDQADSLWRAANQIIADLRENGPNAAELATHIEKERRETEVSARTNEWWLGTIVAQVDADEPLAAITGWSDRLDALTVARVRAAARIVFDPSNVARFTLLPEETR